MDTRGIDVSDYQGTVDWPEVARAGIAFAFAKATEGVSFVAKTFADNWSGMRAAGIARGAYHFFRPSADPEAQANHFLSTVHLELDDLPPALDVEVRDGVDAGAFVDRAKRWLDVVERSTERKPIVYCSPAFWQALGSPSLSDNPLWVANYGVSSPTIPGDWTAYTFWQYSSGGSIGGITGSVDLNVFNGDADGLVEFLRTGKTPSGVQASGSLFTEGNRGPEIEEIQRLLRTKGFDPGSPDGIFGARTKEAVEAFQRANSLIVDGVVGPQTLAELRS
jgi:lysozyme